MANKQTSQCALVDHYCPRLCCWILGFSQCVLNTQALHNMFTQVFFSASHWETETDYSNTAAYLPPFPSWANLSFDSLQGKRVKPLPTTTATTEYSLHRQRSSTLHGWRLLTGVCVIVMHCKCKRSAWHAFQSLMPHKKGFFFCLESSHLSLS